MTSSSADVYTKIVQEGVRKGADGEPTAQRTALGWIVFGGVGAAPSNDSVVLATNLEEQEPIQELLKDFWELEEADYSRNLTTEDLDCERLPRRV